MVDLAVQYFQKLYADSLLAAAQTERVQKPLCLPVKDLLPQDQHKEPNEEKVQQRDPPPPPQDKGSGF